MSSFLRRLKTFDTVTPLSLENRTSGTYDVEFFIEGNSILSTIFVESIDPGATILASYWDSTIGTEVGEEFPLVEHRPMTEAGNDRLTVTRIHNKPNLRVVVSGGSARFGVYITVVSSFASDLDSALQYENEDVQILRDKGMPIAAYEITTDAWSFLRTKNGRLQIDVPGVLQVTQQTINFRRYNQTLSLVPNTPTTHIDFTVPTGSRLFWSAGSGSADGWVKWTVEIDGVRWLTKRNAFDDPNVNLGLGSPTILEAGQRILVTVENVGEFLNNCEAETWLYGALETI